MTTDSWEVLENNASEIAKFPSNCRVRTKTQGTGMVVGPEIIEQYESYHWRVVHDTDRPKHSVWTRRWGVKLDNPPSYFADGVAYFWEKDMERI